MVPTLQPGDQVFVDCHAYDHATPQVNDLVVSLDPRDSSRHLVKRVSTVSNLGKELRLLGDNPGKSTDSRHFGAVNLDQILGKVTSRLP